MLTMLGELSGAALVYFVDGPTLHTPDALTCLSEGSQIADYCALYDNPAMYTGSGTVSPSGLVGNFYVFQGGETTRVVVTGSAHWKYTHTPTLNIGATVARLLQDTPTFTELPLSTIHTGHVQPDVVLDREDRHGRVLHASEGDACRHGISGTHR